MPIINEPRVRPADEAEAAEDIALKAAAAERRGDWDESAALYARTFRSALFEGWVERAADALRGQARVRQQQGRYEEAEELAELSRELADRHDLTQAAARALNILGIVRYSLQDWAGAEERYRRALEMALDLGDDELIGLTCQNLGVMANLQGDLREARSRYLESVGSFVRSGSSANAMMAYNNLGMAATELREWMEAEVYFGRGIEIAERLAHTRLAGMLYSNLAEPLIKIGEIGRARDSLTTAEEAAARVRDVATLADVARYRGMIARAEGDFAAAEGYFLRSVELAAAPELDLEKAKALRELGELYLAQGRRAEAREALGRALGYFRAFGAASHAADVEEQLRRADAAGGAEAK